MSRRNVLWGVENPASSVIWRCRPLCRVARWPGVFFYTWVVRLLIGRSPPRCVRRLSSSRCSSSVAPML
eukprot:9101948-Lingulodinium_polyedra.AAC.1